MGRIQRKVFAVVELYDSFTRKPVAEGSCHVLSEMKKNVIAKENGYFIFLDVPGMEELEIEFSSEIYHSERVKLADIPNRDNYRHQILWMSPNDNYSYPLQTAILKGTLPRGKKNCRFHMVLEKEKHPIYLGQDYEAGDTEIAIHGFLNEQLVGTEGIFYAEGKPVSEIFALTGMTENEEFYRLCKPLGKSYKKGEVQLHRAYPVYEQENRCFCIAFSDWRDKKSKCDLLNNGKIADTWEIEVGENGREE